MKATENNCGSGLGLGTGGQLAEVASKGYSLPCFLAVWNRIIEPVAAMRKEADMLRLFPEYLKGEELFGLTVHAVLRIAESVRKGLGAGGLGGH